MKFLTLFGLSLVWVFLRDLIQRMGKLKAVNIPFCYNDRPSMYMYVRRRGEIGGKRQDMWHPGVVSGKLVKMLIVDPLGILSFLTYS